MFFIKQTNMVKEVIASFRVDEQLWREARAYAVRNGITTKQLVEFLISKELEEQRFLKEVKKE